MCDSDSPGLTAATAVYHLIPFLSPFNSPVLLYLLYVCFWFTKALFLAVFVLHLFCFQLIFTLRYRSWFLLCWILSLIFWFEFSAWFPCFVYPVGQLSQYRPMSPNVMPSSDFNDTQSPITELLRYLRVFHLMVKMCLCHNFCQYEASESKLGGHSNAQGDRRVVDTIWTVGCEWNGQ